MAVIENNSKKFLLFLKLFILIQFFQIITLIWTIISTYSYSHWLFIHEYRNNVMVHEPIFDTILTHVYHQVSLIYLQLIQLINYFQDPINVLVLMLVLIILQMFNVTVSLIGYIKQSVFYITSSFIVNCLLIVFNIINTLNSSDLVLNIILIVVSLSGSFVTINLRHEMSPDVNGNHTRKSIGELTNLLSNQLLINC